MLTFIKAGMRGIVRRTVASVAAGMGAFLYGSSHYDAAEDEEGRRKHWARARENNAKQANSPPVRKKIRTKCRYEADNNCYMSGLVSTLAVDVIGYTAPKLQVLTEDTEVNTFVETEWLAWSEHKNVNLSSKLRVLDETRRIEGEAFLLMVPDESVLNDTGYNLNLTIIGPARVTDEHSGFISANIERQVTTEDGVTYTRRLINDDGVIVDATTGEPVEFKVKSVVEDYTFNRTINNTATVSARYMLQWFCPRRPGQFRGVCELAPALPLYAQLRDYGLATLSAAEIAALFAGIMTAPVPPGEEPPKIEPGFRIELERGTLMSVPEGTSVQQLKAEHPITNYESFVNIILREIGRAIDVPFGIVAGDSSKYNYSSAQLDYRGYEERLSFDKKQLIIRIMNPVHRGEWIKELANRKQVDSIKEELRKRLKRLLDSNKYYHTWHFSRRPSSDPVKDATAEDMRLKNGTTNYAEIYAARGLDYEEMWDQREKENKIISKKKLVFQGISDTISVDTSTPSSDGVSDSSDPTNTKPDIPLATSVASDVQQSALNGAQIASLEAIAEKVANGVYSVKAATLMLRVSFPTADSALLTDLVVELSKSKGSNEPSTTPNETATVA